jgi:hypothetical protein
LFFSLIVGPMLCECWMRGRRNEFEPARCWGLV